MIVAEKARLGDWEGDNSVTDTHKHAINTVNERVSSLVAFTKLTQKTAAQTADAVIRKLRSHVAYTITFDNGSEFTVTERVNTPPALTSTSLIRTALGNVEPTKTATANCGLISRNEWTSVTLPKKS
ncbi:MAG: hypothetical protein U5L95_00040 [Candidatus Saccharibacteria bacterium]|nr:hypothetical protein [Candidatus Saccharibacteria bacterium]